GFRTKKTGDRRQFFLFEYLVAKNFMEQSERSAAGFFDRLVAARQTERTQMRDAFDAFVGDEEKFAAPNRAVEAVTRAVPRNTEHRRRNFVFRHARQNVRNVVLDGNVA